MEFSRVNIYLNDLGNKSNRSGFFVDPELVPNPSLYSPANVKQKVVENNSLVNLTQDFWEAYAKYIVLPLSTCTLTETAFPIAGEHVYVPASEGRASWTTRKLAVISPFSVITLTPPRGES